MAWAYDSAEAGGLETQPIVVDGVLYANTPTHKAVALDAATGKLLWRFDAGVESGGPNRGVTYWRSGDDERIFAAVDQYLYGLDARTGRPIKSFGDRGRLDLRKDLDRDPRQLSVVLTSPGVIYKDLLIVGGRVSEGAGAAPGHIRAYDTRTGLLRWTFHTIPRPDEQGHDTWPKDAWTYSGGANNWAGMAVDERRGVVYVPTGSATSDFYGADRHGDNLFANSLLALEAQTGHRIWHFQTVHHDLWDRDLPAPPSLVTVERDGRRIDAVAQITKQGFIFLFDRTTGLPLFPIEERPFPSSTVEGERASQTQPVPLAPAPFARQALTADILTSRTLEAHKNALEAFMRIRSEGQFAPLGVDQSAIVFPGFSGGAGWGGAAFDPETRLLYVNSTEMAWTGSLTAGNGTAAGRGLYLAQCAECHGDDLRGAPPQIPPLVDLRKRTTAQQVTAIIRQGKGRMPSFSNLRYDDALVLTEYLRGGPDSGIGESIRQAGKSFFAGLKEMIDDLRDRTKEPRVDREQARYRFTGYKKFLDLDNYPAVAPPWGTLNAVDLNTGQFAWRVPLGEYPALVARGVKNTGTENDGGLIVTAGGLVFIAATSYDKKLRAFDKSTGEVLWEATLPFAGNATPITYAIDGRQFIVIAAGGGKANGPSGGVYVAFALP